MDFYITKLLAVSHILDNTPYKYSKWKRPHMPNSSNSSDNWFQVVFFCTTNGVSALVCTLAIFLVFYLKLFGKVVYRLALYQVVAALAFATVETLETIFINDDGTESPYAKACTAIGWLVVYTQWTKLLLTLWVTLHLFCLAVLYKNPRKLEALYVPTSVFVPALIASVPLLTGTYGLSPNRRCYITNSEWNGHIERFALFDGPAMVILLAASFAMIVMVVKLSCTMCWRTGYEPLHEGDQLWKALKQLLPLAAFPLLFFVFVIPVITLDIYGARRPSQSKAVPFTNAVFVSLWSMASGVTLISHIAVARLCSKKAAENANKAANRGSNTRPTFHHESPSFMKNTTRFALPDGSLADEA